MVLADSRGGHAVECWTYVTHTRRQQIREIKCVLQQYMWQSVCMKILSLYCIIFQTPVGFHMPLSRPKGSCSQMSLGNAVKYCQFT